MQHPLALVDRARALGYTVLLDAAAFVPTSPLSLRRIPADFVACSFYKMFGYPTGVGALIARREALARLRRPWFAGGTVEYVSVQHGSHLLREGAEGFEDGTVSFLDAEAVIRGLDFLDGVGMARIRRHVAALAASLVERLARADARRRLADDSPVRAARPLRLRRHGDVQRARRARRGGAVRAGRGARTPRRRLGARRLLLQSRRVGGGVRVRRRSHRGCIAETRREGWSLERFARRMRACGGAHAIGAVRASVGMASSEQDLERLIEVVVASNWHQERRA